MKKSYLSTTLKAQDLELHWLFRVLFIVFFSTIILNVQAQCPIASAKASLTTICSGTIASITLSANQVGTTYGWTIVQEGIVGAADGTGTLIAQTLTATDATSGSVVYTITPLANGCKGPSSSVKITVNPIPVITATPLTSTIASNSAVSIALTSEAAETEFSWTVIQSGTDGAIAGSGSVINQVLTANAQKGIATYRITPDLDGCAGEPINAKVIVKR
ncbi:MAG: PKD-like domain-containing protein [Bacteroidota bacterium]|nr:PKD-like domain-containing protein [Bacteroidota bacterium]